VKHKMNALFIVTLFAAVVAAPGAARDKGNIHPNFRLSFSERFRLVTWDNTITLTDTASAGTSFTRHRTGIMGQWYPAKPIELALKLTNEFRYYFVPEDRQFGLDEIIIDQLYLKWENARGTLTLGRQNIMLGEGFLVMDGHPLDGSRSIYFNAVRFDCKIDPDRKLILFGTYQPEIDDLLPVIHDRDMQLIEQPERGLGAYFIGDFHKLNLQSYFIRKNVSPTGPRPVRSRINTIGSRIQYPPAGQLSFAAEAAYQFGQYGDADRSAFGGYAHFDYGIDGTCCMPRLLSAGFIYLSGDDPHTRQHEDWNPLFARWPKWSESYIYSQIREDDVAYWTNMISLHGKGEFDFSKDVTLLFDYHHLMAPQKSVDTVGFPGGTGRTRGELLIGLLEFRINEHTTGHLLWEYFEPGNYYFREADAYSWVRAELLFRI
jgi:hypothetical protein